MLTRVSSLLGTLWLCACTGSIGTETGVPAPTGTNNTTSAQDTAAAAGVGGASGGLTTVTSSATATTTDSTATSGGMPTTNVPVTTDDINSVPDPLALPDLVTATSQLPRLTHGQYENALRDLLYLDVDVVSEFASEQATLDGYYAPATLRVNERLYLDYQRVAEALAERLALDESAYTLVVGCSPSATTCRDEFLDRFLLRAYRRPATATEIARFRTLFDTARELLQSGDDFADGVQLVVQAALQSPNFLYRVERGSADPSSVVELTSFEKASRLSFMLTDAPPDTTLLAEAETGGLQDGMGITTQAARLMSLPAFVDKVRDFHHRWLQLDGVLGASKDETAFPEFSVELASSMQQETLRFVEEATLNENGAIIALLSAPYAFVNQPLAAVYGLSGSYTSELERVDFSASDPRMGLFTQPAFLTGHSSSSTRTSPILRAVYLLRRILCQKVPDPPPGAEATEPPPPAVEPVTTREFFGWKTSLPSCASCHSTINPIGFAFEEFDAIGRHRATENGAPVDTSGSLSLNGETLQFQGARELLAGLATSPEVRACYAKHWLQFSYGRNDGSEDLRTLAILHQALANPAYGVRDLVLGLTQSAAFSSLLRAAE